MPLILSAAGASAAPPAICRRVPLVTGVARYARAMEASDQRRIARFYGRDGVLVGDQGAPISGAGEVAAFLARFAGYHVTNEAMTVRAVTRTATGWHVSGTFRQTGTAPGGDGYTAKGVFRADWVCRRDGWGVARLATGPDAG